MQTSTHVFNQYYFELLKKIRDAARAKKKNSANAQAIVDAIKAAYQKYDTSSDEYRDWFERSAATAEGQDLEVYVGMKASLIRKVFDSVALDHFINILKLFSSKDLSEDTVSRSVTVLQSLNKPKDEFETLLQLVSDDNMRGRLTEIYKTHVAKKGSEMDDAMKRIEGTGLGKLAKEIMQDINMDELQKTMDDGDIMKSLSNPEGPLTKVLSTVSAKMISKMASGELQQESLLADALSLAKDMGMSGPGGRGGAGPSGLAGLGDLGSILQGMQSMGMGGGFGSAGNRSKPRRKHPKKKNV